MTGTSANSRYYLTTDKTCSACPSSCAKCTATACSECDAGYGLSTDKKSCVVCSTLTKIDNCMLCDDAQSDGNATCTACSNGYYLADDNSYCNLTSLLGANCDDIQDHAPECDTCDSSEVWTLEYDDDEDDFTYPKRCAMECYQCGSATIDASGNVIITGDPEVCNPKKNINMTETVMCKEGACGVAIQFDTDGKTMLGVARGCSSNITEIREIMEEVRTSTKKREQEKERSGCLKDENNKNALCGYLCYDTELCNNEYYGAAGTVYASVMVVMGALIYSLSNTL